jgi:hypothetical protein
MKGGHVRTLKGSEVVREFETDEREWSEVTTVDSL